MTRAPVLELKDAVVRRDGRDILRVEAFALHEGERVAVIGPNGAGKSTLVKLLTREAIPLWREDPPVRFRGEARPELAHTKTIVGVVSTSMQEQVDVGLSAFDVVVGGLLGALGVPRGRTVTDEMRDRALEALEELGVAGLAHRDMRTLSTGEARRVLVARALVHRPEVLVFDEPCAGLDPEAAFHVRAMFAELASAGRTMLLVTHHVEDIVPAFERTVAVRDGAVVADGPTRVVLTTDTMRGLFSVPVTLEERDGHYRLW